MPPQTGTRFLYFMNLSQSFSYPSIFAVGFGFEFGFGFGFGFDVGVDVEFGFETDDEESQCERRGQERKKREENDLRLNEGSVGRSVRIKSS